MFDSIDSVEAALLARAYFSGREAATRVFLAQRLAKPLLVQGPEGCGKAALAEAVAASCGGSPWHLCCHGGITPDEALFAWDTGKQLLRLRQGESRGEAPGALEREVFTAPYLLKRPFLEALSAPSEAVPVLLIEDIDLAPEAFQTWLAGVVADWSVEVPHLGLVRAVAPPLTFLTCVSGVGTGSLARASLFLELSYASFETETEILLAKVAGLSRGLAAQVAHAAGHLRGLPLRAPPGVGESLDLARALLSLRAQTLSAETLDQVLGCALKHHDDLATARAGGLARFTRPAIDRSG